LLIGGEGLRKVVEMGSELLVEGDLRGSGSDFRVALEVLRMSLAHADN